MAELKLRDDETPSQAIIKKSTETVYVTDESGRKLGVKEPNYLKQTHFMRILPDNSPQRYINMVLPVMYLVSIDDDVVSLPKNELQLDSLLNRLDTDGIIAITQAVKDHFSGDVSPESIELQNLLPKLSTELIADFIEQSKAYIENQQLDDGREQLKKPQPTTD